MDVHMVELVSRSSEACLNIPQTFSVSKLSKGHAEKLVPAREAFDLVIAVALCDAFAKFVDRKEFH